MNAYERTYLNAAHVFAVGRLLALTVRTSLRVGGGPVGVPAAWTGRGRAICLSRAPGFGRSCGNNLQPRSREPETRMQMRAGRRPGLQRRRQPWPHCLLLQQPPPRPHARPPPSLPLRSHRAAASMCLGSDRTESAPGRLSRPHDTHRQHW